MTIHLSTIVIHDEVSVVLNSIQDLKPQWKTNPWTPDRVRGDDRTFILNLMRIHV